MYIIYTFYPLLFVPFTFVFYACSCFVLILPVLVHDHLLFVPPSHHFLPLPPTRSNDIILDLSVHFQQLPSLTVAVPPGLMPGPRCTYQFKAGVCSKYVLTGTLRFTCYRNN